jgi:hypothetical protein
LTENEKGKYIAVKATGTGLAGTATAITAEAITASTFEQKKYEYKFTSTAEIAQGAKLIDNADITVYNAVALAPVANTTGDTATYPYKIRLRTDNGQVKNQEGYMPSTSTEADINSLITVAAGGTSKGGTGFFVVAKTAGTLTLHHILAASKNMVIYDVTAGKEAQKFTAGTEVIINDISQALTEGHIYYVYANSTDNSYTCGFKYLTSAPSKVIE